MKLPNGEYFTYRTSDYINFCGGIILLDFNDLTGDPSKHVFCRTWEDVVANLVSQYTSRSTFYMADVVGGYAERWWKHLPNRVGIYTITVSEPYINPNSGNKVRDCIIRRQPGGVDGT